jgi:cellulase/cellobiase CelA1/ferric-dicitrate binding protein FerR (iron transport regulator)
MKTDWHDLIQRHISELTMEEEDMILEAALQQDDAVARLYLRYMNLDVALEAQAAALEAVAEILISADAAAPAIETRWFSWRPLIAAAAALVVGFLISHWWPGTQGSAPLVVESGSTTLDFAHGARVTVHGPASVQRLGPAEMRLLSGRLTAVVPREARGFAIETSAGRVVDLGTQFGVLAAAAGSVEVHVFEGRVEVTPRKHAAVPLVAGEAVVLSAERGVIGRLPADESKLRDGTAQPAGRHLDNPFVGAAFYRNVDYTASVNAAADRQAGQYAQQMRRVAEFPTFVWLDSIAAVQGGGSYARGLAGHLDEALAQNANAIGIVIYDMPNRDGSALASNGELLIAQNGFHRYKTEYIDAIFKILNQPKYATLRVVMVIEPDSLPNLITNLSFPRVAEAQRTGVYVEGVQYAIGTLRALSNTYAYIDVAHAGWLGWSHNLKSFAELLKQVGKGIPGGNGKVDGLISNTANYNVFVEPFMRPDQKVKGREVRSLRGWYDWNDHIEEQSYANALRDELIKGVDAYPATLGLLLDTSRNGWGGPDRPAGPSSSTDLRTFVHASTLDKRTHKGNWGNQSGAGIGARPVANPAPNYDAFVWVKPPGYSDGSSKLIPKGPENPDGKGFDRMCDPTYKGNDLNGHTRTNAMPDAPVAGRWFQAQFEELVRNAYPPL